MKYKTIIFDLDGTLLNTLADLHTSVNYALCLHRMKKRSKEEVRHFLGNGVRRLIELSVPNGTSSKDIEDTLNDFRRHYLKHSLDCTAPYDGIEELLKQLHDKGIEMAIVSNKLDSAVKELHRKFFSKYIKLAIGETDNIRRKPAPDMVEECIRQLGCEKTSCIYVGDSEVDLLTATNAGIPCCSVSWGFRDKQQLIDVGARIIIDTPDELLNHL